MQRDVALKVLPGIDHVHSGAQADARIARFKREAQVLASLNHPNIAAIYGFVEGRSAAGGTNVPVYALALELVEGPTLAERIAQGSIAVNEALAIAGHGRLVSFSRKVFIPLTYLCRDVCHYCTFARPPRPGERPYLLPEEVLAIARAGRAMG